MSWGPTTQKFGAGAPTSFKGQAMDPNADRKVRVVTTGMVLVGFVVSVTADVLTLDTKGGIRPVQVGRIKLVAPVAA